MKNLFSKILFKISAITFTALASQQLIWAQAATPTTTYSITNPLALANIADAISRATAFVTPVAVLGFIGCVIYAGFIRLFSQGDAEKEKKSMRIATSGAIGFALVFGAKLILSLVAAAIGVSPVQLL